MSVKNLLWASLFFFFAFGSTTAVVILFKNPFEEMTAFQRIVLFALEFPLDWTTVFGLLTGMFFYSLFYTLIFGLLIFGISYFSGWLLKK